MRDRRYWLRLFRLFAVALAVTLLAVPMALGGVMMWGLTHPGCGRTVDPSQYGLAYEDVSFTSPRGYMLRGFFMPGDNGATVLVVPTYANDRGGDLPDAAIFNRAGFNVLT